MGEGFSVYPPPPRVARFKKSWIIAATVVVGGVMAAAVAFGLINRPTVNRGAAEGRAVAPDRHTLTDRLNSVPEDYADVGQFLERAAPEIPPAEPVPTLGPPLHGELGNIELKQRRAGRATLPSTRNDVAFGSPIQFGRIGRSNAAPPTSANQGATTPPSAAFVQSEQSAGAPAAADAGWGRQNNQAGKREFLDRSRTAMALGASPLRAAPWSALMAGTVIPATLITAINSDLPGHIIAQVTAPVFDSIRGEATLIPQGSKLIGEYDSDVAYAQARALVSTLR